MGSNSIALYNIGGWYGIKFESKEAVMPKYDSLRKTERDYEIRKYAKKNPTFSHQEIAEKFSLSRSNVTRIINTK